MFKVHLKSGPLGVLISWHMMEAFELLVSVLTLSLVLFSQVMLAGGLAVTSHSIITVSNSLGLLLSPLMDNLLRGTV